MKINQRQIERMAKRMGMEMQNIDAQEVIIRTPGKEIIINNPQVSRVNMMGQDTFQISGDVTEKASEPFTDADVEMVKAQTGCTESEARSILRDVNGDLAEAILKMKEKKG